MAQPNHPWNPLPIEAHGDTDPDNIYRAVGQTLSGWESLEGILAMVFSMLCASENEGAERAYGVVSSFSGRYDMLMEAYSCHPQRSVIAEFPKLLERIKQFGARRNEIAHGIVRPRYTQTDETTWYLAPADYSSRKRLSRAVLGELSFKPDDPIPWEVELKYAYTSWQILHYRAEFVRLSSEVLKQFAALLVRLRMDAEDRGGGVSGS